MDRSARIRRIEESINHVRIELDSLANSLRGMVAEERPVLHPGMVVRYRHWRSGDPGVGLVCDDGSIAWTAGTHLTPERAAANHEHLVVIFDGGGQVQ